MKKTQFNAYIAAGKALRRLRQEKGLTLQDLSERAEISISYLSHIERGTRQSPLTTLENLAQILGVNLYELFNPPQAENVLRENPSPYDAKIKSLLKGLSDSQKKSFHHLLKEFHKRKK